MRLILGILIGIGLTLGAAYVHDMNLAGTPVVNWDVLADITHDQTSFIRTQWNKMFQ